MKTAYLRLAYASGLVLIGVYGYVTLWGARGIPALLLQRNQIRQYEEDIANLLLCRDADEREQAIRGVAGYTQIGRSRDAAMVQRLRERGVIRRPADLGIDPLDADRRLLAARSIKDLVHWSGGLYAPPSKFRNW